ncbi:brain protein I3-like isoform X2 [Ctenocephalides felis]|uniref:brain protein I3-like isoform X2 n=1 Tax=Ctenocephalides felis TaxID=7515 RepID=UPI000E6E41C3|nr:brain protein I3-like isoform X2 [Ctenocephalides felis]
MNKMDSGSAQPLHQQSQFGGRPQTQQPGPLRASAMQSKALLQVPFSPANSCPNCGVGFVTDNYSCCAVCLGACCFPLGLLCCLGMKERSCVNCGAAFN